MNNTADNADAPLTPGNPDGAPGKITPGDTPPDKKLTTRKKPRMKSEWRVLLTVVALGIILIIAMTTQVIVVTNSWRVNTIMYVQTFGTIGLIGGGFFCSGGLIGFLFGIPRVLQNNSQKIEEATNSKRAVLQNDNLVQISDWVTKIIVGVGLTQLYNIPTVLLKMGRHLAPSFGSTDMAKGQNAAIATILYFLVAGFISLYLWARLKFAQRLNEVENDLENDLDDDAA